MRLLVAVVIAFAVTGCAATGTVRAPGVGDDDPATRQILVTVRQPAAIVAGLTGPPNQRYLQRRYGPSPSVDRILTQLAHELGLRRVEGWPIQSLDVYCEVLLVPEGRDVASVITALSRDARVDLRPRVDTVLESRSVGRQDPRQAGDFHQIQTDPDQHRASGGERRAYKPADFRRS